MAGMVNSGESKVLPRALQEKSPLHSGQEGNGWVSPTYSVSKKLTLDPSHLERQRCIAYWWVAREIESYRLLRTQILQRIPDNKGAVVMVTSAEAGTGKSLTAVNLAMTCAKEFNQTVLLVDCDLRNQTVHRLLGYEQDKGLVDHLVRDCPISELIVWPGIEKMTVISGGATIHGSSELLSSQRMRELIQDMKHRYPNRLIIFDVPAVLDGADAAVLAPLVDHILMVVRAGDTRTDQIKSALNLLPRERILGYVLNDTGRLTTSA
jgi:non-specific protein-tyrosine kinase